MANLFEIFLINLFYSYIHFFAYIVGVIASLYYWKTYPKISRFAFVGFSILLLSLTLIILLDSIQYLYHNDLSNYYVVIIPTSSIIHTILRVIAWSLILYAMFGERAERIVYRTVPKKEPIGFVDQGHHI